MKKLLSTLFLASLMPAVMFARPVADMAKPITEAQPAKVNTPAFLKADMAKPAILSKFYSPKLENGKLDTLGSWSSVYFSGYTGANNVIVYEPQTNSVLLSSPDWEITDAGFGSAGMEMITYADGGKTSVGTFEVAKNTDFGVIAAPSFDVVNTIPGNTDPTKLNIFVSGVAYPVTNNLSRQGAGFYFYDPANTNAAGEAYSGYAHHFGPTANYEWRNLYPLGVKDESNNAWYICGSPLFAKEGSGEKHGRYGFIGAENTESHEIWLSQFSSEFGVDKFKAPTANGIYNEQSYFDQDATGKVYAIVNNIYADNESRRYPAVATSEDFGYTWSEFDKMPWSVLDDFVGGLTDGQYTAEEISTYFIPYSSSDFVVTGPDQFSYITKMGVADPQTGNTFFRGIVEVYKENGTWGIRPISDMRTFNETQQVFGGYDLRCLYSTTVNGVEDELVSDFADNGNEIEVGRTADGQYIVAKWIEYRYTKDATYGDAGIKDIEFYGEDVADSVMVNYPQTQDDGSTTYTKDWLTYYLPINIYVSYKKVGETTWSEPKNLNEDNQIYFNTHMPAVLPNFTATEKNIPVSSTLATEKSYSTNSAKEDIVFSSLDPNLRKWAIYVHRSVVYGLYNLEAEQSGVKEESLFNVGVYPNPANGEFTVQPETEGFNLVEVYTMLGEKVMEMSGVQSQFTASANGLTNGVYVVKVTNNGKVASSLLTITK